MEDAPTPSPNEPDTEAARPHFSELESDSGDINDTPKPARKKARKDNGKLSLRVQVEHEKTTLAESDAEMGDAELLAPDKIDTATSRCVLTTLRICQARLLHSPSTSFCSHSAPMPVTFSHTFSQLTPFKLGTSPHIRLVHVEVQCKSDVHQLSRKPTTSSSVSGFW